MQDEDGLAEEMPLPNPGFGNPTDDVLEDADDEHEEEEDEEKADELVTKVWHIKLVTWFWFGNQLGNQLWLPNQNHVTIALCF